MITNKEFAEELKKAFYEGYESYSTPCSAYNTADDAWEESESKKIHDFYLSK